MNGNGHNGARRALQAHDRGRLEHHAPAHRALAATSTSCELVGTAGNGLEAIEMFRKMDPDVVTMDITMPQMDGIECIEKHRED